MRTCIVELQRCGIICQPEEAVRVQVDPSQSDTNVVSINEFLVPLYDTANMNKFDPHAVGTKLLGIADRCRVRDPRYSHYPRYTYFSSLLGI